MLTNLRDLGGMVGAGGKKIKPNMLIRSDRLSKATDEDIKKLEAIPVTMIFDFRTPMEEEVDHDREVKGAVNLHLPVIETFNTHVTKEENPDLSTIPKVVEQMVKDETFSFRYFIEFYQQMVEFEHCRNIYKTFLEGVLANASKGASLWHCTQGKDRAGIGTLLVLTLLGVSEADIRKDYMKTNESTADEIEESVKQFMGMFEGLSEQPVYDFVTAREEYIDTYYEAAEKNYGGIEGFIRNGLGLDDEFIAKFRNTFLE